MHYIMHRLTASMVYFSSELLRLRSHTRQPTTIGFALLADWSFRPQLNRVSSVQFIYVVLYALLRSIFFEPNSFP